MAELNTLGPDAGIKAYSHSDLIDAAERGAWWLTRMGLVDFQDDIGMSSSSMTECQLY